MTSRLTHELLVVTMIFNEFGFDTRRVPFRLRRTQHRDLNQVGLVFINSLEASRTSSIRKQNPPEKAMTVTRDGD
ncbi:hypothetical protein FHL15_008901 [Xylaria flabelliformis]|uniref:Uncharacterized protein n=1 Tax=Xylaria flabelliformis TaxID=2512241 RepID=A0A553HQE9_9PEZI|nr:hypothetical protein FHL15_008901 [Xylaria flabelliformis]